ncbi:hypothetical protein AVEN_203630-1 [Araneus ventricosus]|uniref:Uncharacterized protein n=1 Tax=Araneus ventricosus TaxID=182803 RepID=A0A4Y2WTL9_ARAVE|nr:hypothetical protein AVEN_203630-1 [Araneus ventricosus]
MNLVELIPRFSGKNDSIKSFIKKIDEVGQLNNWFPVERLTILKLKICDDAEKFVSLNIRDEEINDYDHVVNALISESYSGISNSILQIQASGDNPGIGNTNNSALLGRFRAGFKSELQRQVLSKYPRTLDDAIESTRIEEKIVKTQLAIENRHAQI